MNSRISNFIQSFPIPDQFVRAAAIDGLSANIDDLPDGVVTGSTVVSFAPSLSPTVRSSVVMSLLAAERIADTDSIVVSPDLWVERYNMILKGLNWFNLQGGVSTQELSSTNVSVHDSILPFLTLALGPGVAATSLVLKAMEQMKKMDESTPWIVLFDRESRRFDVSEYRFATVEDQGSTVVLRMAAARFKATQDKVQILFFKMNDSNISLKVSAATLAASTSILEEINGDLRAKLAGKTKDFLSELNF